MNDIDTRGSKESLRHRLGRLYRNEAHVDFQRMWRWSLPAAAVTVLISLLLVLTLGLNLGIEFEGGAAWEMPANGVEVADAREVMSDFGFSDARIQTGDDTLRVRAEIEVGDERVAGITAALADLTGVRLNEVTVTVVGPSWGDEITDKAIRALVVFFVVIAGYISIRLQWKMALAALIAVFHDIMLTIGVYALFQFTVTPATVIAFLTIMGYSLYDTLVVFDRARDNEHRLAAGGRHTYGEIMNLSLNQVFMRSVNTTITSLLPVGSVLVVGSQIMGAKTLEEFAIALLIGLITGAASSLFIAPPIAVWLKEREPRWQEVSERAERRGAKPLPRRQVAEPAETKSTGSTAPTVSGQAAGRTPTGAIPPRPRKKKRRN